MRAPKGLTHPAYQLDWNLVRTFVAVVDSGSLAAAARRMGLSHPTVARHVQLLEQNLGVDLFDRTSSGLSINEAGTRLAEAASRMQRDAIAFEAVSDTVKTSTVGTARITVAEILAELFPALLSPLQQFPTSERMIELVISNQSLNLLERECDIAIRHVRPVQTELICRKVGSLSFAAWASASYLADVGEPTRVGNCGTTPLPGRSDTGIVQSTRDGTRPRTRGLGGCATPGTPYLVAETSIRSCRGRAPRVSQCAREACDLTRGGVELAPTRARALRAHQQTNRPWRITT